MLGAIGSGKSFVARRVAELVPARIVDADAIAHEGLRTFAADGRLAQAVGAEFVHDGKPDVKALGARAFEDPALLRRLERLVHPYVHAAIKAAVEEFRAGHGPALLVLDAPLLIEVGLDRQCDVLWYVESSDEVRAERAARRGMTLEQIRLREAFQSPRERKRARADRVLHNDAEAAGPGVDAQALDAQILEGLAAARVVQPSATSGDGGAAPLAAPGGPGARCEAQDDRRVENAS